MKTIPPAFEILMATLAGEANSTGVTTLGPNYPNGWSTLAYIRGAASPPNAPEVQGFLANGYSDPQDPTSEQIAVLALGMNWTSFFQYYQYGSPPDPLSSSITGVTDGSLTIDDLYNTAYLAARDSIWDSIQQFLGDLPLYICGMNLGGPLAQIAALDLRPGVSPRGPKGQFPPKVQPPCFAFSTPNVSNGALVTFYNQQVKDTDGNIAANTYWAGKLGLSVDFFPTAPTNGILGNPVNISTVKLPAVDVPWLERGNTFYIEQLGGVPQTGPNIPGNMLNLPADFRQTLAYTFALLAAEAYHQAQHSGAVGPGAPGYNLKELVSYNKQPFAFIFESVSTVVAVIRGAITWQEEQQITANSSGVNGNIVPNSSLHAGVSTLYGDTGNSTFRADLNAAIKKVLGSSQKQLFLVGHSLGGAIANLAAVDYATTANSGLQVAGVYTFGSICFGDVIFQMAFNDAIGSKAYQIVRIYDTVATAMLEPAGNYTMLNSPVVLSGMLPKEENTYHSLNGYLQLLNPGV